MPDISRPSGSAPAAGPDRPGTAGLDGPDYRTAADAASDPDAPGVARWVGWEFIVLYALAYIGTILLFLAPCWSVWH